MRQEGRARTVTPQAGNSMRWSKDGSLHRADHCESTIRRLKRSFLCLTLTALALFSLAVAWPLARDAPHQIAAISVLLWITLAAISVHDARRLMIPDRFVGALAIMGMSAVWLLQPGDLPDRLWAMCVGGGAMWLFMRGYAAIRGRDGLGFGDVKLVAAAGAWIGLEGLPTMLALGCATALAAAALRWRVRGRVGAMPFGPHLSFGLWAVWCLGPWT